MSTSTFFEVFGFNTSRSPEKQNPDSHFTNSIHISDFKNGNSTDVIDQIITALLPRTLESLSDVQSIINEFTNTSEYISSKEKINLEVNNVLLVYDYLNRLDELPENLVQEIVSILEIPNLNDITRNEFILKWDMLWNNLVIDLFKPISKDHRVHLIQSIRVLKIISALHSNRLQNYVILRKMLFGVPVLPSGIAPVHIDAQSSNADSTTNPEEVVQGYLTKINQLMSAKKEIEAIESNYRSLSAKVNTNVNWETDEQGRPLISPEEIPDPINFQSLDGVSFNELTDGTKATLAYLGIEGDVDISYSNLKQKITDSLNELNMKVFNPSFASQKGIFEGGVLFGIDDVILGPPNNNTWPIEPFPGFETPCRVKPIGVSDYRRVEAIWSRYEAGEIAHIENLLKGEYKDRETRHLRSTEETYSLETIKENEVIRDLQTTERFALQKEASSIVQEDFEAKLDAYVNGNYGTVSFGVSGGVSFAQSSTNSKQEASQYAKDVIDRSVNRILERTREERTIKILEEYEEKNIHKLDNVNGVQHVVGVYRWVDKIMKCQLANYGKRLLFEFMVPEPAAFHIFAKTRKSIKGVYVEKPIHPRIGIANPFVSGATLILTNPKDLTEVNYQVWAGAYGASVEAFPKPIDLGMAYSDSQGIIPPGQWIIKAGSSNDFKIPDGYVTNDCEIRYMNDTMNSHSISLSIGDYYINSWTFGNGVGYANFVLDNFSGTLPVTWLFNSASCASFNVILHCIPSNQKIEEWQSATYKTIMEAYQKKLDDFNNAVSEAQVSQGITIEGNNPLINREIEKTELRKWCIQLMTENNFFYQFNAMKHELEDEPNYDNYPYFDNCEAIKEGHIVRFIENILDWNLMSYFLYPYFYGNRDRWVEIYNTSSIDPLHTSFLQAGFARVVIPVRLGFESIAMQFVETGLVNYDTQSWVATSQEAIDAQIELQENAFLKNPPLPTDPDYTDWLESDLNPDNWPNWEVRLPTNLVILQDSCPVNSDTALPVNPNV